MSFIFSGSKSFPAVFIQDKVITYEKLFSCISYGKKLLSSYVNKGEKVAIIADNSFEYIVSLLSIWELGLKAVLINNKLTEKEIIKQLAFVNPKLVISDSTVEYSGGENLSITEFISGGDTADEVYFSYDDVALIIFTSGTTSTPKGVEHSLNTIISSIKNTNILLKHSPEDKWLASLPFYHIGGLMTFLRPLYYGASVILPASTKSVDIVEYIDDNYLSFISLVSTQLRYFLDNNVSPPPRLKYSLIGGGFISDELFLEAKVKGWKPVKVYGSTETASFVTAHTYNDDDIPGSVGIPVGNAEIVIDKTIWGNNTMGEIIVRADSLFIGYYNNKSETAAKLKRGSYYSEDIGYLSDNNYLIIVARRDDLIITGGENVYASEVEKILLSYNGIKEAAVIGVDDVKWGHSIVAAVVADAAIEKQLLKYLKKQLAGFKIPKKIYFFETFPKTPLGKIKKEELKGLLEKFS
jgi:o-succinylbenzoate---CoA ligase